MNRTIAFILTCLSGCGLASFAVAAETKVAQPSPDPAAAGRVLLGELNCAACHAATPAQSAWLTPKPAPRLMEIGVRVDPAWVPRYLADPHDAMPGVTMPDLLDRYPVAERPAVAEALTHYLFSVSPAKAKKVLPDRAAVRRGETLYHQVGCVACHAPQDGKPTSANSVPLPTMAGKWAFDGLRRFLRDPLSLRPGGRMPTLNLTDGEAADIAQYLLRETKIPAAVEVTQFRPPIRALEDLDSAEASRTFPAEDLTLEMLGRDRGFAVRFGSFLQIDQPGKYTFHLTTAGASRLAIDGNWLIGQESWRRERVDGQAKLTLDAGLHAVAVDFVQRGQKDPSLKVEWEGPGIAREAIPAARLRSTREVVPEQPTFSVDAEKAAKGKAFYAELNCAACHENRPSAPAAMALANLDASRGCLAEKPAGRAPDYHLDAKSLGAIRSAVASLKPADLLPPSAPVQLAHALATFRCTACHIRDGLGGVPADRDAYFTSNGEDLGEEGRLPPILTGVGNKLRPDAIAAVLTKASAVRPYLNTRMPQFGEANVLPLPEWFVKLDRQPMAISPSKDTPELQREAGRKLVGTDGLSCVACHRFNRQPAQTMQVVDLTTVTERLNEDWFRQFLIDPNRFHPGTRMPSLWPEGKSLLAKVLDGDTARQQAALWTYLSDGGRAKFPEGLGRQNVELVVGGETVVYRGKLWEAGFRGIAVGHPGGLNFAFDAEECRLSLLWKGRFLNAGPHWMVQGMGQIRPLGTDVVVLPHGSPMAVLPEASSPWPAGLPRDLGLKFGGYQLDPANRPTFFYAFSGKRIEDWITPVEGDKAGLRRTITLVDSPAAKTYLRLAVGKLSPSGNASWRLNDALTISVRTGGAAVLRGTGDQKELLLPLPTDDKSRKLEVDYAW